MSFTSCSPRSRDYSRTTAELFLEHGISLEVMPVLVLVLAITVVIRSAAELPPRYSTLADWSENNHVHLCAMENPTRSFGVKLRLTNPTVTLLKKIHCHRVCSHICCQ